MVSINDILLFFFICYGLIGAFPQFSTNIPDLLDVTTLSVRCIVCIYWVLFK